MTWDVDSSDSSACSRLRRFVFGKTVEADGGAYRYPGFVDREGVCHVGQSVLFVTRERLVELAAFLHNQGIDHVVKRGSVGGNFPC